jgi:hypothetical protein
MQLSGKYLVMPLHTATPPKPDKAKSSIALIRDFPEITELLFIFSSSSIGCAANNTIRTICNISKHAGTDTLFISDFGIQLFSDYDQGRLTRVTRRLGRRKNCKCPNQEASLKSTAAKEGQHVLDGDGEEQNKGCILAGRNQKVLRLATPAVA